MEFWVPVSEGTCGAGVYVWCIYINMGVAGCVCVGSCLCLCLCVLLDPAANLLDPACVLRRACVIRKAWQLCGVMQRVWHVTYVKRMGMRRKALPRSARASYAAYAPRAQQPRRRSARRMQRVGAARSVCALGVCRAWRMAACVAYAGVVGVCGAVMVARRRRRQVAQGACRR